jgi:hypothetical protein
MGNILNQHEVTIEIVGRTVSGTYSTWAGIITVSTAHGSKSKQIGGSSSNLALKALARIMLRELANEGKA